ncbi:MAG TPA: amino acid adenylation domain-containing protein [Pseudonocardiaceae bacterium]
MIEAQVRRHRDRPAVVSDEAVLSFGELDARANRLAHLLIERGAGPETIVALILPRSVDIVVAQLAVLKAGAAFLPVDPDYPAERIEFMLADAAPVLAVARADVRARCPVPCLALDEPGTVADLAARSGSSPTDEDRIAPLLTAHPAYVIYTSGSTGRPKGVVVTHGGLPGFSAAEIDRFAVRPGDRVLQFSSPSFDASVLELCMSLPAGAALVVPPPGPLVGRHLADVLAGHRVTHALIPPVALATVPEAELPHLRTLIVGGDACGAELVDHWAAGRHLINAYGPTEATVVSTWSEPLSPGQGTPPIGRPIPGTHAHVLDAELTPVAAGAAGELYVAGPGLARGYLRRPGLTAERFVANPFGPPGSRMYRTGDVVRPRDDGQLDFVGRADHQVKIRGFRIEPGEIEARLRLHPGVRDAVVVGRADGSGPKRLVAYVVAREGHEPSPAELRTLVAGSLPDHMIPSAFVVLDAFPLSPNGKLDRGALPAVPAATAAPAGRTPPRTDRERDLALIWCDVLGLDEVGVEDDFFRLGGDSILGVMVLSRIRAAFGAELSPRAIFDAPTVAGLAELLPAGSPAGADRPIGRVPDDRPVPLSPAQRRLWMLDDVADGGTEYNTGVGLRLSGPLDVAVLRRALDALAERHEALRTTFGIAGGEPVQVIADEGSIPLRTVDLGPVPRPHRDAELEAALAAELELPFDLRRGPLTRAVLVRLSPAEHVLMLSQHHIVTDGRSVEVLVAELAELYAAGGDAGGLAPLPVRYADFAAWQRDRLDDRRARADLEHWRRRLDGLEPLDLPADRPRPPRPTTPGAVHRRPLPADLVRRLTTVGQAHDATPFVTLTAAVVALLARWSGRRDLAVGTVSSGRDRAELEGIAGFFVNTLVLRSDVRPRLAFTELVSQVRETVLDAFAHDRVPFDRLVEELRPRRDAGRAPLVQAMVVLQQQLVRPARMGDLRIAEHPLPRTRARFDLVVEFWPVDGALTLAVEYNTDLFDAATIEHLAERFEALLHAVVAEPDRPVSALPAPRAPGRVEPAGSDAEDSTDDTDDTEGRADRGPTAGAPYLAPRTPVEETLAAVFAEVLNVARVGVRDNFFELGGDSIVGIQVVTRAREAGLALTARDIFAHQTIAALAPHVTPVAGGAPGAPGAAGEDAVTGPVPLTPIQHWLLHRDGPPPERFAQSLVVELDGEGPLDEAALDTALAAVVAHHDALRLRFGRTGDGWRQHHGATDDDPPGDHAAGEDVPGGGPAFDLARGPLIRATTAGGRAVRLTAHHLVVDGVSWRVVAEDLRTAYRQVVAGGPVRLRPRTTPFGRWATLLAGHVAAGGFDDERAHWAAVAEAAATVPALPVDRTGPPEGRPPNTTASARSVTVRLSPEETAALLHRVPAAYRTQVNDVLLTALADTLAGWTGDRRVLLDLEGHGREELFDGVDLTRTVGWFTTVFPVLLELPGEHPAEHPAERGGDRWGDALKAIKEQLRAVPRRGIGHGALRYLAEAPPPVCRPQVSLNYLGQFDPGIGRLELDADPASPRTHALEVVGQVDRGALELTWSYSADLHERHTVEALAEAMRAALVEIVRHCARPGAGGRTPSDFPLARLDQPAVDRLAGDGRDVEDIYPLTPMQAGMVFHGLSRDDQGVYFQQTCFVLGGVPDPRRLADAWQYVVDRTPVLRSSVAWEGVTEPVQVVHRAATLPVTHHDWSDVSEERRRELLRQLLDEDRAEHLDLGSAPLMRLALARLPGDEVQVVWTFHHVLLDGWSVFQVLSDVFARHARAAELPARPPFRDYVAWVRGRDDEPAERYWRGVLGDLEAPTPLPFDRAPTGPHTSRTTGRHEVALTEAESAALYRFARRHRLTPSTVVQGAWAILLSRHGGRRDVCFGATVSGRPAELPDVDAITGMLINTLPVRVGVDGGAAVAPWLRDLQAAQAESRRFEHVPLTKVQSWSGVPGGTALFDSAVVFENYPIDAEAAAAHGLRLRDLTAEETTNFALSATVYPGERLSVLLGWEPELFDTATVRTLGEHLRRLLTELPADPERPLAALPMLTDEELRRTVVEWNDTAHPVAPATLPDLVEAQARRTPGATAVVFEDAELTYAELDERADRLAHRLVALGAGPETIVAVALPRSVELVVTLLAVLKAGAAYLPVDPDLPVERIRFVLDDARPVLLVDDPLDACDTAGTPGAGDPPTGPPPARRDPAHPAYVIYTSGSTGRPKGVVVPHRGIVNRLLWMQHEYRLGPGDRVLQKTPASFDVSVWEFFWPLVVGATLVVARPEGHRDPAYLARLIRERAVTTVHFVPSMLREFLREPTAAGCTGLRRVLCSGEALPPDLVAGFAAVLDVELHNLYGPTEASVDVTYWRCERDPVTVPIGRPVWNTALYVLDADLRPAPVGVPGELYLSGVQLARGYLNRPGLTSERFVADPFGAPGSRMYRTGDLARWRPDGAVEYLGRTDHQVKIRGFRVEPGEIEAVLAGHDGVTGVAVVEHEQRLVAYVAPADADHGALRERAAARLPAYMVPAVFVALDRLPLSPNGKLDRRALPAPDLGAAAADRYVAPRTETERAVARIWAEALGVERVGVEDGFFDLGGDSIRSLHITSVARAAFGIELAPRDVLTTGTVSALADLVEERILQELERLAVGDGTDHGKVRN